MNSDSTPKALHSEIQNLHGEISAMRESLKASQKEILEYRQIVENANSAILKISFNGNIEYMNPFAQELFGEMMSDGDLKIVYQNVLNKTTDEQMSVARMIDKLLESELKTLQHERYIKTQRGRELWISWTNRLLYDEGNKARGLIAIGVDISKRKLAEDAMRESEFNLTKAQEVAKIGSWVWETDSDNIHCSNYLLNIFGIFPVSSYRHLLKQLDGIIYPEYRNFINQKISKAVNKGTTESYTYRILHPSGEMRWIMEEISLLGDINKRKQMLIGTVRDITDQKRAEDKLKEYLLIVSSSSELMSLIDLDYRYVNVNQAYLDAYQKKSDEIEGHTVKEMFGAETFYTIIKPNIDRCLLGEHLTDQYWFAFPNGKNCFMDVKYNPVLEMDGTISGVTVSARDITDLKKTEEQLNIFKLFAQESGVGFGMANMDGEITYVNSRLSSMAGYSETSALMGENILKTFLGVYKVKLFNEILPVIKTKGQFTGEMDIVRKDGIVIHTIANFFIIRDQQEAPVSFALTITDITDRKLAEEALQQSENNFRTIFTNAAIGIDVVDEKGKFVQVNKAIAQMLGYSTKELMRMKVADVTWPDDRGLSKKSLKDIFTGKKNFYRIQKRYRRKDGNFFWADLSVANYHDVVNNRKLAIGTLIDISEAKHLHEELHLSREEAIKANKAKSEFLANMSHEIRTPLNAVIGFTELLETMLNDSKQINYLQSIKAGGKNLLMLINDILDLSKIEAGKLEFKYEAVNPYFLIEEIKQIFSIKIAEKDIDFIVDVEEDIPASLILDEVRVRQIIFNLIGNAIKFTEKGFVKFSAHRLISKNDNSKIDLLVDVEDTGIGIPIDQQSHIFDAFQQQSGQSTRKYGGTGLGLSISKRLVEMMGGHISLKSTEGKGSVFSFSLPGIAIGATVDDAMAEDDLDVGNIEFEPTKILIVDDVESNRRIISENFSAPHITVVEAEDGQKAQLLASQFMPDVIFMDIRMPVMDGFEATRLIKTRKKTRHIKVIALTASVRSEDQDDNYQKYFDGYLCKPVTRAELYRELMRFLPYKEIRAKVSTADLPTLSIVESINSISLSPKLAQKLSIEIEKELLPMWEQANTFQMSDEIEAFATRIKYIGKHYKLLIFTNYGTELGNAVSHFDVEKMDSQLRLFPEIAKQLQNRISEKL